MQHEITSRAPLLDAAGNLREAGYAKRLLPVYDRAAIRAGAARIKEWDYYLVANDHYAVALTIDDNGYMGLDSISFLHFDERWDCLLYTSARGATRLTSGSADTPPGAGHQKARQHGRGCAFRPAGAPPSSRGRPSDCCARG